VTRGTPPRTSAPTVADEQPGDLAHAQALAAAADVDGDERQDAIVARQSRHRPRGRDDRAIIGS